MFWEALNLELSVPLVHTYFDVRFVERTLKKILKMYEVVLNCVMVIIQA